MHLFYMAKPHLSRKQAFPMYKMQFFSPKEKLLKLGVSDAPKLQGRAAAEAPTLPPSTLERSLGTLVREVRFEGGGGKKSGHGACITAPASPPLTIQGVSERHHFTLF